MKVLLLINLLFTCVLNQYVDEYEEIVGVELQLEDYDLSDACEEISATTKKALLTQNFNPKIEAEIKLGKLAKEISLRNLKFESNVPFSLTRNWTLLTKTGDFLLPQNNFTSLVYFQNFVQELGLKSEIACSSLNDSDCFITRQDYIDTLVTSRNGTNLNQTWTTWQEKFDDLKSNFTSNLELINKVLTTNDAHTPRGYWEKLTECENCYSQVEQLWKDVEPLYRKLHEFVRVRLNNYYKFSSNESLIPVYLLGSNFGTDWSKVADIILPHPYLFDEVQTELKFRTTKEIYKLAEVASKTLGVGTLGSKFWLKSNFNHSSCGPNIFRYCDKEYTELITCNKLNWTEYLDIHETTIDVALRNHEYTSIPRQEMRFSVITEALKGLGSLIAIDNLPKNDFIPLNAFNKSKHDEFSRKDTALLLIALRILPKLPYYFLADSWRLGELDFSYGNLTETWWEKRNEIQGVRGNSNLEADYLDDQFIASNKPHLSKFMGIFLEFQLLDYYQRYFANENGTLIDFIATDEHFKQLISEIPAKNWAESTAYHYGINEISSGPLLDYFKPLEKYLEAAPVEQVKFSTTPKIRTTTTTEAPTKRRKTSKIVQVNGSSTEKIKSVPKDDVETGDKKLVEVTDTASNKLTILLSVAGLVVAVVVFYVILKKFCRSKPTKINNRRFET